MRAMSHLDELDDYEADLELKLKREYSAVFGLFRYCVVTQDSTYLCNKYALAERPQASYPFFSSRNGRRLGVGQEPPVADDSSGGGLHIERCDGRGTS